MNNYLQIILFFSNNFTLIFGDFFKSGNLCTAFAFAEVAFFDKTNASIFLRGLKPCPTTEYRFPFLHLTTMNNSTNQSLNNFPFLR